MILLLLLFCKLLLLLVDPHFQPLNRLALDRQFHVGVHRVHAVSAGMAHESLADFLHNPGFHQPRVEGMAKIVKAEMADI